MPETTRLMASFPCLECGATLLTAEPEGRELECPRCGAEAKAPKRLIDDLELGKKLPFDAPAEAQQAIDHHVESAHVGPEAPGLLILALAVVSAVLGSYAYGHSVLRPTNGDWALGGGLGLVMVMLPFGFTLQWLATSELARKVGRATTMIRKLDPRCPRCDHPLMAPPSPGTFDCTACKGSLVAAGGLIIVDESPRKNRWTEAVASALESERWIDEGGIRHPQKWMMVVVVFACLTAVWFGLGAT